MDPAAAPATRVPSSAGHVRRIVVALDGPASSGKSSVGAAAAARLGLRFLDTGLIYRAMTAMALREGAGLDDAGALVPLAARVSLGDDGTGRLTRVLLDGAGRHGLDPQRCRGRRGVRRGARAGGPGGAAVRASAHWRPAVGSSWSAATSAPSCSRMPASRCSSTRPSRRGPTGGSPSGAWTLMATRRRSSASSCAPATSRTATAPWRPCARPMMPSTSPMTARSREAVDSVVTAILAAEEATA